MVSASNNQGPLRAGALPGAHVRTDCRGRFRRCAAVEHIAAAYPDVVSPFVAGVYPPEPDPDQPDQTFGADAWAMWTGASFAAPQISGAVARLCYEQAGLTPRAALELLLADRPHLPDHGRVLRPLPGTPTG